MIVDAAICEQAMADFKAAWGAGHDSQIRNLQFPSSRPNLTRQAGFILAIYDEYGLTLAATTPFSTSAEAFRDAQMTVDNKVEEPRK